MYPALFNILACPICKVSLHYDSVAQELICRADRLAFPIKEGIPVMFASKARALSLEEYEKLT